MASLPRNCLPSSPTVPDIWEDPDKPLALKYSQPGTTNRVKLRTMRVKTGTREDLRMNVRPCKVLQIAKLNKKTQRPTSLPNGLKIVIPNVCCQNLQSMVG